MNAVVDAPFKNPAPQRDALLQAFTRVLDAGGAAPRRELHLFETAFARHCEAAHAVGVANGPDALLLALRALGVGAGDEVIVPSHSPIAPWLAVQHTGATPVPVEPDPATGNIDAARVAPAITRRTKLLLVVHHDGQPADMHALCIVAREHGLKVLEDASQAHGARWREQRIGAHGDAVAWSFAPGSNLAALGEAGAVTTRDAALAEKIRQLRSGEWHSPLGEIEAALLSTQLPLLDAGNTQRALLAKRYLLGLRHETLALPVVAEGAMPVWHRFVVRHPQRDRLAALLHEAGVKVQLPPAPPHRQPGFADLGLRAGALPVAEMLQAQSLALPIEPTQTLAQIDEVIAVLRHALAELRQRL